MRTWREFLFEKKFIKKDNGCWIWTASITTAGYGQFCAGNHKMVLAHRFAWEMFNGKIPDGNDIHHKCNNKRCVNPDHLEIVIDLNHPDNTASLNRNKTHCPQRHEYTKENTYMLKRATGYKSRQCRVCKSMKNSPKIIKAGILIFCCLYFSASAVAQVFCKYDQALVAGNSSAGIVAKPASGAQVTVCPAFSAGTPCNPKSNLFDKNGNGISNPVTADSNGNYGFCTASPGRFMIQVGGTSFTTIVQDNIIFPTDPSNPVFGAITGTSLTISGLSALNGGGTLSGTFGGNPIFSGNVLIGGTIGVSGTSALGVVNAGAVTTSTLNTGQITSSGAFNITGSTGLTTTTGTTLWIAGNFGSPHLGRIFIGDGTGWQLDFSKRVGGVTTDLITIKDNGGILINTSSGTLPALISNDTGGGVAISNNAGKAFQFDNFTNVLFPGSTSGNTIVKAPAVASGTLTLPAATDQLVARTTTDTVTNKRVTPRIVTLTSSTTFTPDSDNSDLTTMVMTAGSGTLTIAAPTGTPTDGQKLILRIKATNSQTYSFNATYAFSTTVVAPTTLGAGKTDYIGLLWDATNTKWDVVAVDQGH